jgi:ATP-dependent DNA helicase DinG
MSTEQQLQLIGEAYRAIASMFPNFRPRPQQQAMMRRAARLLTANDIQDAPSIGMIDAPTGTGKSLGYLLPGLIAAATDDRRLILSTATASLQDQLAVKDVPMVLRALEQVGLSGISFAIAKGRERHVCPLRLEAQTTNQSLFSGTEDFQMMRDEFDGGWNGLKDTLRTPIKANAWRMVNNTASSCTGRACPSFEACPYYKSLEACKNARLVIVNHDYLLTTLARVPNSFLANADRNLYVFDEAHHLGDKILSAFAHALDLNDFLEDEMRRVLDMLGGKSGTPLSISAERMHGLWRACTSNVDRLLGDGSQHRFTLGEVPPSLASLLRELAFAIQDFQDMLANASKNASRGKSNFGFVVESVVGQLRGELARAQQTCENFIDDKQPFARWLRRGRRTLELCCSPFDSASLARKHLWPTIKRGVLTSATLTTLGSFDSARNSLGLPKNTSTLKLDSPFDYSRSRIVVPKLAVEGSDASHSGMVKAYLSEFAIKSSQLGVLVYFTSRKLMQDCYDALPAEDRDLVLLQGDLQPWAMVEQHKSRIDRGERSILFGMDSISEGVDLPGVYCTRVIITKLPFPSMTDPVIATHAEHLISKGVEPFRVLVLPKTGQKLAQITGRLVRTDGDHGDILILDQRMRLRQYGKSLLQSTPFRNIEAHVTA